MTTRNVRRRIAPTLAALACASLVLGGCASDDEGGVAADAATPSDDELARHDGEPCPDTLPTGEQTDQHGFDTSEPAAEAPALPEPDRVWVCRFVPEEVGPAGRGGVRLEWRLDGREEIRDAEEREVVLRPLARLVLPTGGQMCPADLGPRYLVVLVDTDGDSTGVAVDDYGCSDARLTDEPHTAAPGEPAGGEVPAGFLLAPAGYSDALAELVGPRGSE